MTDNFIIAVENITAELTELEGKIQRLPEERYKRIMPAVFDMLVELTRAGHFPAVKASMKRLRSAVYANQGRKPFDHDG